MLASGWMKGCMAEGTLDEELMRRATNIACFLQGWGADVVESIKVSGTGGSARCQYQNKKGESKSFQIGSHLMRVTNKSKKKTSVFQQYMELCNRLKTDDVNIDYTVVLECIEAYFSEVETFWKFHLHRFLTPETRSQEMEKFSGYSMAVNYLNQHTSRIANHLDPETVLPAVLSMVNPIPSRPFKYGELMLTETAFEVNYREADLVMIDGYKTWHAVNPIEPKNDGIKQPIRCSIIHFSNMKSKM